MRLGRSIVVGVLAWLALVVAALVQGWIWPRTLVAWAATLVLGPTVFVLVELVGELAVKGIVRLPGASALASWLNAGGRLTGVRAVVFLALILGVTLPILLLSVRLYAGGVSLTPPGLRQWFHTNFVGGD
jgi:hypothetical protein